MIAIISPTIEPTPTKKEGGRKILCNTNIPQIMKSKTDSYEIHEKVS
jgi:hypothetical protein